MAALEPDQLKTDADGATSCSGEPATPKPGRYKIDTSCSAVRFGPGTSSGWHRFAVARDPGRDGRRRRAAHRLEHLRRNRPASFRTGNGQRDSNVRSAGLLDVGRYPVITFSSEGIDGLTLTGALTVRNVTMPVSLSIEQSAVTPRSFTRTPPRASTGMSSA